MSGDKQSMTIGQCAALACVIEATAPKPGNVHRGADFEDMSYPDLVASAIAIGPCMDAASRGERVGRTVLQAVQATRRLVDKNTNLGTALLLAPLARVPRETPLNAGIRGVLATLDADDARDVYIAIRRAQPGGLGRVEESDIAAPAPADLLVAMRLAADRDLVARQYVEDFALVLEMVAPSIARGVQRGWSLLDAVVHTQLRLLSAHPDSLIARKCGAQVAQQAADHAADVVSRGEPGDGAYEDGLADLDFWLRADGHRRNPGTTADLIAAGLFVVLREGDIPSPLQFHAS